MTLTFCNEASTWLHGFHLTLFLVVKFCQNAETRGEQKTFVRKLEHWSFFHCEVQETNCATHDLDHKDRIISSSSFCFMFHIDIFIHLPLTIVSLYFCKSAMRMILYEIHPHSKIMFFIVLQNKLTMWQSSISLLVVMLHLKTSI